MNSVTGDSMDAFKEIEALELELTSPEVRRNTNRLDQLLSDEFEEFGSSGAVIKKPDVLASLPNAAPATYELSDFAFKKLSDGCILVTYRSLCGGRAAHRSSIWMNYNGSWQMLHHQATVISTGI